MKHAVPSPNVQARGERSQKHYSRQTGLTDDCARSRQKALAGKCRAACCLWAGHGANCLRLTPVGRSGGADCRARNRDMKADEERCDQRWYSTPALFKNERVKLGSESREEIKTGGRRVISGRLPGRLCRRRARGTILCEYALNGNLLSGAACLASAGNYIPLPEDYKRYF